MQEEIHYDTAQELVNNFSCRSFSNAVLRFCKGVEDVDAFSAVQERRVDRDGVDTTSDREGYYPKPILFRVIKSVTANKQLHYWPVVEIDKEVVAYAEIEPWKEEDGTWVYLIDCWVDVDWRGKGIGTSLLQWSEKYVIQLASFEHPKEPFEFAANASSTEKEATSLLLREGYTAPFTVIDFRLDHTTLFDIPELPVGIDVRPIKPQYIHRLIDSIKRSYESESEDGRYVEPLIEAEYEEIISKPPHDASLWQVAWEHDEIIGQVLPVIRDGFAEIYEVSIQKPWRRKHIARALLLRAISVVRKKGIEEIRVYTLSTFPTQAKELYRSVGFKIYKEFPRYRKSL